MRRVVFTGADDVKAVPPDEANGLDMKSREGPGATPAADDVEVVPPIHTTPFASPAARDAPETVRLANDNTSSRNDSVQNGSVMTETQTRAETKTAI